jgi:hypothetical protein
MSQFGSSLELKTNKTLKFKRGGIRKRMSFVFGDDS